MTALVEKQAFITLIEDLFHSTRESDTCICSSCTFHISIKELVSYSNSPSDCFITFSDRALRKLRHSQSSMADKIYLTYKTQIPFKFTYLVEDYFKQLCKKAELKVDEDTTYKDQVSRLFDGIQSEPAHIEEKPNSIEHRLLTKMRGIDYTKIVQYLIMLNHKNRKLGMAKHGSKTGTYRDNISSPNEGISDSDSKF